MGDVAKLPSSTGKDVMSWLLSSILFAVPRDLAVMDNNIIPSIIDFTSNDG